MFTLSQKISQVQSSPTISLNELAGKLRKEGKDVINLGIGEPLNDCPERAADQAKGILDSRQVKYTPASGNTDLKEGIRSYTQEHYGRKPELKNITVANGAKQALFNLLQVILDPGDEVIIFSPYWVSYPEMIKLAQGIPVIAGTNDQFMPEMEQVIPAVSGKTRAIILNSPNNPTGAVYSPEFIAALVDLCESRKIYLVMDDIYHQLVFDPFEWVPGYVFTSNPIDKSHLVIINGISKTYGMTGFRIGWAVGPEPLIKAMNKIQGHSTSGVSAILQGAAVGALDGGAQTLTDLMALVQANRNTLLHELWKIKGIKLAEPGGAFYCFPDFSALFPDSQKLASLILEKAFVATVPGIAFGQEGHLRISFTCSNDQILEGARRIRWVTDRDSPREITIDGKTLVRDWEI